MEIVLIAGVALVAVLGAVAWLIGFARAIRRDALQQRLHTYARRD